MMVIRESKMRPEPLLSIIFKIIKLCSFDLGRHKKKMDAIKVVDSRRFEIDRMRIICIFQKKCLNIKSRVQKSKSFVIQFDQK